MLEINTNNCYRTPFIKLSKNKKVKLMPMLFNIPLIGKIIMRIYNLILLSFLMALKVNKEYIFTDVKGC